MHWSVRAALTEIWPYGRVCVTLQLCYTVLYNIDLLQHNEAYDEKAPQLHQGQLL